METDKELLEKDLCPRLPYGVKALRPNNRTILEVEGYEPGTLIFREQGDGGTSYTYGSIGGSKLILRDMSDLTKEITHKGETFVPMVELAKMIGFDVSEYELKEENGTIVMLGKTINRDSMIYSFNFFDVDIDEDGVSFSYGRITVVNGSESIYYYPFKNQPKLYDWLDKHHFNRRNLPAHLWVDINTLSENPYA